MVILQGSILDRIDENI